MLDRFRRGCAAHPRRTAATAVGGAIVLAMVAGSALMWARLDKFEADLAGSGGGTTYLLIGSDSRARVPAGQSKAFGSAATVRGERADLVLLVRRGPDGRVRSLGIPRDLVVFEPDQGPNRLALTLADGPGHVADLLCSNLGIGVDHVVVGRFDGVDRLVRLADGVEVRSDETLQDTRSGMFVWKGRNRLDGVQALAYVRARHVDRRVGDTWVPDPVRSAQRPERATTVLRSLSERLPVGPTNPVGTVRAAWGALGSVSVDGATGPVDLLRLASTASKLGGSDTSTLPVVQTDGAVPVASLAPAAPRAIRDFLGRRTSPGCGQPALGPGGD